MKWALEIHSGLLAAFWSSIDQQICYTISTFQQVLIYSQAFKWHRKWVLWFWWRNIQLSETGIKNKIFCTFILNCILNIILYLIFDLSNYSYNIKSFSKNSRKMYFGICSILTVTDLWVQQKNCYENLCYISLKSLVLFISALSRHKVKEKESIFKYLRKSRFWICIGSIMFSKQYHCASICFYHLQFQEFFQLKLGWILVTDGVMHLTCKRETTVHFIDITSSMVNATVV